MPRLTYWPSCSSAAHRAASWNRVSAMSGLLPRAHGALLHLLALGADLDDPLHEHARGVYVLGVDLARLDELFDLGDRDPAGHRAQRVEVARGLVVDEVAVPITHRGPHQREVAHDAELE